MDTTAIKKGLVIEIDNAPYVVVDFQFVSPGKGSAFFRTKIKNMLTGAVLEKTYKSGEKLDAADTEDRNMEYIFNDGTNYTFMDVETYEQVEIAREKIESEIGFLLENTEVRVLFYKSEPMSITLPNFVEIEIAETGPSEKGNTVTTSYKPAELTTGGTVMVPMFLKAGEVIKIDTREKKYVERVK